MTASSDGNDVSPADRVLLRVRHGDVPSSPPPDLAAFCAPIADARLGHDWELTDDALAFGDRRVVLRYADWRESWEQAWTLGASDMLAVLRDMFLSSADTLSDDGRRLLDMLCLTTPEWPGVQLPLHDLIRLDDVMQIVRHDLHGRGRVGFGVVDATPGSTRVGLLRAWVGTGTGIVLSSANGVSVVVDDEGIGIRFADGRPALVGVENVDITGESTIVSGREGTSSLDPLEARPLHWLIPESVAWRVRIVPAVVAWADAFSGVSDARQIAAALGCGATLLRVPMWARPTQRRASDRT